MALSRRKLLVGAAAVAAVAALGIPAVELPPAAPGLLVLSEYERALVAALGEAFFPPDNALGIDAAAVGIADEVDRLVGDELDPIVAPVFRYLLRALDVGTTASRGAGFASLPLPERRAVLDTWADNAVLPRRLAFDTFKTVLGLAFFNVPAVKQAVGWTLPACHAGST